MRNSQWNCASVPVGKSLPSQDGCDHRGAEVVTTALHTTVLRPGGGLLSILPHRGGALLEKCGHQAGQRASPPPSSPPATCG